MFTEHYKIHPIYGEAYRLTSELWQNPIILKNWREPLNIIKNLGCEVVPYNYQKVKHLSKEGYCTYRNGKFFVAFNVNNVLVRITFTIDHELGHIVCSHPIRSGNILCQSCSSIRKKHIETEASLAGRNIHFPAPIITSLEKSFGRNATIRYLQYAYYISEDYATNRMNILSEDLYYMNFDDINFEAEIKKEKENMIAFLVTGTCNRFGGEYRVNDFTDTKLKELNIMKILEEKRKEVNYINSFY